LTLFHIVESIFIQSFEDEFSKAGVLEAELLEEMKLKARSYSEELTERLRSDGLGFSTSLKIANRIVAAILEESRRCMCFRPTVEPTNAPPDTSAL
jgi:hypothetical protein